MSFASDSGYTPSTFETHMLSVMNNVNTLYGTTYTAETFIGTNWYKMFYALIQRVQENEIKTSEIFSKLTDYFALTNERISRPVVTSPGVISALEAADFIASVKPPENADAGKLYICVDIDEDDPDYADTQLAINTIIKDSVVAGVVTQGTELNSIVLSNGQSFDFRYNLPTRITPLLRLTITTSENNQVVIDNPDEIKNTLMANISERYRLGKNFEPQRYFSLIDAPWAETVLLEWSTNSGTTWNSTVYDAPYNELFVILLENITLVEA